jgi:hypothetical protein
MEVNDHRHAPQPAERGDPCLSIQAAADADMNVNYVYPVARQKVGESGVTSDGLQ